MEILITNQQEARPLNLDRLNRRILRILEGSGSAADSELSLLITDDAGIAPLNQQYLGRPGPTNVIAFPMAEGEDGGLTPSLLGDVVVSVETAWREAAEHGLDPEEHFLRLVTHGILHLLGHDHVGDEAAARAMEELTERLLALGQGEGE